MYEYLVRDYDARDVDLCGYDDGGVHAPHDCLVLDCRGVRVVRDGATLQMTIGNVWARC